MAAAYWQLLATQRNLFDMNQQYSEALERAWRAALGLQGFVIDE